MRTGLAKACHTLLWPLLGVQLLLVATAVGQSDDFEYSNWDEVPEVVAQNQGRFRAIFHGGLDRMRRVMILGDSQETSPGGPGKVYIPHLNYQMWKKIGHLGETALMHVSVAGSGNPPADWLRAVTIGSNGPQPTSIAPERIPPGLKIVQSLLPSTGGPQEVGGFVCLVHDGRLTADPWLEPLEYMNPEASITPEVFVYTKPDSGGVGWKLRPTDDPIAWTPVTESGTFPVDPSDTSVEIVSARGEILSRGDRKYHRIELHGTDPKESVEIAGVRFVDSRNHHGISIQSFSSPGYSSNSLLSMHDQSGAMMRALEFDIAIIQYGANDARGVGPQTYHERLLGLIDFIRLEMDDPCFPVVLVGDPWRRVPSWIDDRQDLFPAALQRIVNDDPSVMAVNMRRILQDRYGWGPANRDHLVDEAHLEPYAQRTVARELVRVLWGGSELACPFDLNGDGTVDSLDVNECLISWGTVGLCGQAADFNGDGQVDGEDLEQLFQRIGPCPERPADDGGIGFHGIR
ncbi:MAG: dockerin type I domain-containing protein [Phycisphaerales bacterium]|nr:dockerin type I domain-containing protein [Phycisphaerales bacterium]